MANGANNHKKILLAHGGGGSAAQKLIRNVFLRRFDNPVAAAQEDAALLPAGLGGSRSADENKPLLMTTDGYTVSPIFFPGGDIGSLAVTGTCNDLAVSGGRPLYLSASFIIEEGFSQNDLERIADSMAATLNTAGAQLVCGDTKVVPRGAADGVFITTTGIGQQEMPVSVHQLQEGDTILISGTVGDHGAVIFSRREGIELDSDLESDIALLWPMVEALAEGGIRVRAMRDMTRGGMAAVLNEMSQASQVTIEVEEKQLPVHPTVQGICELLGFEPFTLANEGAMIVVVHPDDAHRAVETMRRFPQGSRANQIGRVKSGRNRRPEVQLVSAWGTGRILEAPQGETLPRIC